MRGLVLGLALVSAPLHADERVGDGLLTFDANDAPKDARQLFQEGVAAYELGNYLKAARAFEAAYEKSRRYALLWNLGQAYRKQFELDHDVAHLRRARTVFENYGKLSTSDEERREGQAAARECDEIEKSAAPEPTPIVKPAPAAPSTKIDLAVPAPATLQKKPLITVEKPRETSSRRWLWPVLGVGAAVVVAAVIWVAVWASRTDYSASGRSSCPSCPTWSP